MESFADWVVDFSLSDEWGVEGQFTSVCLCLCFGFVLSCIVPPEPVVGQDVPGWATLEMLSVASVTFSWAISVYDFWESGFTLSDMESVALLRLHMGWNGLAFCSVLAWRPRIQVYLPGVRHVD